MRGNSDHRAAIAPVRNFSCSELSCGLPLTIESEFVAKIGVVLEEADEAVFWLELLRDLDHVSDT